MVMVGHSRRWWCPLAVAALLLLAAGPGRGQEAKLAISGYDPVAYFTVGKPVPGQGEFEHRWHNARWRFASAAHRDAFASNPDRYAPQYDGYCAGGIASKSPHKDTVDPEAWAIVDGKLYLAHDRHWAELWRQNAAENIKRADEVWKTAKDLAEPVIVGAPCRERPESVIITTSDGKREIVVGSQTALDSEGKLVGKGDMRAQIEQIGKNIDVCLKAVGASKSNIVLTHTYVADKAMFAKNADMWTRYLGAEPAASAVETKQLANPDVLVEIRAVALLN
jgi:enamine deaminase RidA (YjgF/YER057c/UK114 family)